MFMNFKLKKIIKINKLLDERASFLHMYLQFSNEQIKKDVTIIYLNDYLNKLNKENKMQNEKYKGRKKPFNFEIFIE